MKAAEGISRSRPLFAAAMPSCVAPQSDIIIPSKPHSFFAIVLLKYPFWVMYVPFTRL